MPEINGVLVGIVVDTRDPAQQRRIKVHLPSIDQPVSEWARVAIGSGYAPAAVPEVNDEVLVAFEHGDVRRPIVIGGLWDDRDPPPTTRAPKVQLPTGSVFHAIGQNGGSEMCASTASLLQQTAPWLASMECVLGILRMLKPLIDVVGGLPTPSARALQDFARTAAELAPCLMASTAASSQPFVRDLLCLVLQSLRCVLSDSQEQAVSTEAVVPIQAILDSAAPFFTAAGIQTVQLAAVTNIQALADDIARLQIVVDALGGCAEP